MKLLKFTFLAFAALAAVSCDKTNSGWDEPNGGGNGAATGGSVEASIGELTSFDIAVDSTSLTENETIDVDDEDYIENNSFGGVIKITYNEGSASIEGEVSGVSVVADGAHVTATATTKVEFVLSGSTANGSFKLYGDKKNKLTLNGVSITNPTGAAINNQCKKRCYVVVADGTHNSLSDGTGYVLTDGEDMKGTLFSEGKLLFSGTGHLKVNANYKFGICSDDYVLFRPGANVYVNSIAKSGIKTNDAILIRGGVINVECSGTAAKGLKTDGYTQIDGGRLTVLTTGGGEWDSDDNDVTAAAGIKSDSLLTINGGEVRLKSTGAGGKGISTDQKLEVNGGSVKVITTGKQYVYNSYDSKPKGIKSDGDLTINGGKLQVRTTGGEGSEAIESKANLTINDGTVEAYAYDDAINAKLSIAIKGGKVFAYASNNDGIDSNGPLTISGGTVVAIGTTAPEDGFDCDNNTFAITGGTVLGIGGGTTVPSSSASTQPVAVVGAGSIAANSYIALLDGSSNALYAFRLPRAYNSCTFVLSSPSLKKGGSCSVKSGVGVAGGTDFDGLITGCSVDGGSQLASLTFSSIVATSNYSGGMGGGGNPPGGGRMW